MNIIVSQAVRPRDIEMDRMPLMYMDGELNLIVQVYKMRYGEAMLILAPLSDSISLTLKDMGCYSMEAEDRVNIIYGILEEK